MLSRSAESQFIPDDGTDTRATGAFLDVFRALSMREIFGMYHLTKTGKWANKEATEISVVKCCVSLFAAKFCANAIGGGLNDTLI